MSSYFYSRVDRRDFGELITEEGLSKIKIRRTAQIGRIGAPKKNSVLAVWTIDPKETILLPEVVICCDGTQDDWAAWITTFAAKIRPFSAYIRIIAHSDFKRLVAPEPVPDIGVLSWPMVGLILGEVLGASGLPDKSLERLSGTAFISTLSFIMFRTAIIYPDFDNWTHLADIWISAREATKQRIRAIDSKPIIKVCATVMNALGYQGMSKLLNQNDIKISDACRCLLMVPSQFNLSDIFNSDYTLFRDFSESGSREDRVLAFEKFLRLSLSDSTESQETMAFLIGYLASRIAPGMIKHSSMLSDATNRFPTALLWYGFCAGFPEKIDKNSDIAGSRKIDFPLIARRGIRELLRYDNVFSTPMCDIGYLELIALSRTGGDSLEELIKTSQGSLIVELLPGVCTSINISSKKPRSSKDKIIQEQKIIDKMGMSMESLLDLYKDLVQIKKDSNKPEQRQLFSKRSK